MIGIRAFVFTSLKNSSVSFVHDKFSSHSADNVDYTLHTSNVDILIRYTLLDN